MMPSEILGIVYSVVGVVSVAMWLGFNLKKA